MLFTISFDNLATEATADAFETMLAARAADTAGYRFRLRSIAVGCAEDSPVDLPLAVQVRIVDDVSDGGAGTATNALTPEPHDSLGRASVITGGSKYTAEPTTYGDPLFALEMNLRASLIKEWAPEDAPVVNRDQLLGLLVAPRTSAARTISGCMVIEEF